MAGLDINALRREIGVVFLSFNLFPHLTVLQNVTLAPMHVRGSNRGEADRRQGSCWRRSGSRKKRTRGRLSGPAASSGCVRRA
jgi:polar amino acid transport system ATP-binding protein